MKLTEGQIIRLVNEYIGVSGGYFGLPERFTYRTHKEFYSVYCELEGIDPDIEEGTTRERFINILRKASPRNQAKILRGVFKKFSVDCVIPEGAVCSYNGDATKFGKMLNKREVIQQEYLDLAEKLEKSSLSILSDIIDFTSSNSVVAALEDAKALLKDRGAKSAVNRVHTVLHGFLQYVCKQNRINYKEDEGITGLMKILRENHPDLKCDPANEISKIIRAFSPIFDSFNPIRNHYSLAHPNEVLLGEEEAQFVIDIIAACITFIVRKIKLN